MKSITRTIAAAALSAGCLVSLAVLDSNPAKAFSAYTENTAQAVDLDGKSCDSYSDFAREICLDMSINDHLWN